VVQVLRHPFALGLNGAVATIEDDSEAGEAQQLAVLCLTRTGERPVQPAYGVPDPTFAGFSRSAFIAAAARFGPPVRIAAVDVEPVDDTTQSVRIEFA